MMEYSVIACVSRNTNFQPKYPPQIVTAYVTPVDEKNTVIHMVILMPRKEITALDGSTVRGATEDEHRMLVGMTRDVVMDEDYAVLKTARLLRSAATTEELLVETDRTLVQVRRMTVDYGARYGEIDTRKLREIEAAHITVIPCPAHRMDQKGWVHQTAPLLPAQTRGALQTAS